MRARTIAMLLIGGAVSTSASAHIFSTSYYDAGSGKIFTKWYIDESQFLTVPLFPHDPEPDPRVVIYDVAQVIAPIDLEVTAGTLGARWSVTTPLVSTMQSGVFDDPRVPNIEVVLTHMDGQLAGRHDLFELSFAGPQPSPWAFAARAFDVGTGAAVINTGRLDVPSPGGSAVLAAAGLMVARRRRQRSSHG